MERSVHVDDHPLPILALELEEVIFVVDDSRSVPRYLDSEAFFVLDTFDDPRDFIFDLGSSFATEDAKDASVRATEKRSSQGPQSLRW